MKKVFVAILICTISTFSQDVNTKTNIHLIGVDFSTLTGSGLIYRILEGNWGLKCSAYAISSSKDKENSFALGMGIQRNIVIKPLTRLYLLAGTSYTQQNFRDDANYTKKHLNYGAGFGVEARAMQAVKNEDIIFFFEVGEKYFSSRKISESSSNAKLLDSGLVPFFTVGCGVEF